MCLLASFKSIASWKFHLMSQLRSKLSSFEVVPRRGRGRRTFGLNGSHLFLGTGTHPGSETWGANSGPLLTERIFKARSLAARPRPARGFQRALRTAFRHPRVRSNAQARGRACP